MNRHPEWWPRLRQTVADFERRPFRWGETDCACFAAACVHAVTGEDVMASWRGTYSSRLQARARLMWWKHKTVTDAADLALRSAGCIEVPPAFAMTGDIGATTDHVLVVRMPSGFIARDERGGFRVAENVVKAWAVAWPN